MATVTLQQAEQTLRVWEAAAIAIEFGREYVVNGKRVGAGDKDRVAGEVRHWRQTCVRLAATARRDYDEKFGLRRGGLGRRVVGVARRVR